MALPENVLAHHLQPIRGLALAHAVSASFSVGLVDALVNEPRTVGELAMALTLDPQRLDGLVDYLENEGLVRRMGDEVSLTVRGLELPAVRPWYELLVGGYADTFASLPGSLREGAPYGSRNGEMVGIGSCGISQYDALPMVLDLLRGVESPSALVDLGCGDGTFLANVAAAHPALRCIGVEPDAGARDAALATAGRLGLQNFEVLHGDALNPPPSVTNLDGSVCYLTAFVLQEVLEQSGEDAVVDLLARTFAADPDASWIVIEVDLQHPLHDRDSELALGYYNPYFLIHRITQQRLLPQAEWLRIYKAARVQAVAEVRPEKSYDSLGLKFGHLLRAEARP